MHIVRLAVTAALVAVLTIRANDTAATLGAGGLVAVKSSAIGMEFEVLEISVHQVGVKYIFRNSTARDIDLLVAFPLPEINGGAVANIMIDIPSRDPLNFIDFRLRVDGKPVAAKDEVRAFFNGPEITGTLRALGLPLAVLDPSVTAAVNRLRAADRASLTADQWVDCSTRDGKCWPYWQTRIQYYWTQHFPANGAVEIEHTYRPIVGGTGIYADSLRAVAAEIVKPYCGSAEAVEQIENRKRLLGAGNKSDHPVLVTKQIQYILTTGNNWKGPIRNFRLAVSADRADDLVFSCLPDLKRVSPTRYELVRSNFTPERELEVLLVQAAR